MMDVDNEEEQVGSMPTRSDRLIQWARLVATIGIAIPALVASALSFMAYWQSQHNSEQLARVAVGQSAVAGEVEKVHIIVNSQRTEMEKEIAWLKDRILIMHAELEKIAPRPSQAPMP